MQNKISYKRSTFYFYVLLLAGIYNLIWGAWVIVFPKLSFSLHNMEIPKYLEIWQCVGMIVGVYGIGYIATASDPIKHWPIVLVGFLGKVFGPIGFMKALLDGIFPISFMINIIFNDLIWWVPFFMMLKDAYKYNTPTVEPGDLADLKLAPLSVIVALRHQGCTFTRENLEVLKNHYERISNAGFNIYILHMGHNDEIKPLVQSYIAQPLSYISDPDGKYYKSLNLGKASFLKAFGLTEFLKGFKAFLKGHGLGPLRGDGFQLGGVFVIEKNTIVKSFPTIRASETYAFDKIVK